MSREPSAPSTGDEPALDAPPRSAAPFKALGFMLSSLGFAVAAGFPEQLAPLGIEPRDFALLRAIGAAEGLSHQPISHRLPLPPRRMASFLGALPERGLLPRRPP